MKHPRHSLLLACLLAGQCPALACGPFFPNTLLIGADDTLLASPVSDFAVEIGHITVPAPAYKASLATNSLAAETFDAELAELGAALARQPPAGVDADQVLAEFRAVREVMQAHAEAVYEWQQREVFRWYLVKPEPRPAMAPVAMPQGLPGEFSDYLEGSIGFHLGDTNAARQSWERLLARPKEERRNRSTWAAFMLGKTWLSADPDRATGYFEQVRSLAQAGFADSLGLAASSYGWQARAELNRGHYAAACRLYLVQHRAGDPTALLSLRMLARRVIAPPHEQLQAMAGDPLGEQVVSAYIVSRRGLGGYDTPEETRALIQAWLEAVQQAGVAGVQSADRLALAAYQQGFFDVADQWLKLARPGSAMAQWLRAKLLLRAGKVEPAARLLAQVARLFAREGDWADPPTRGGPEQNEAVLFDEDSPLRQAAGEMGVLHLARRQYYEALDTLVRAGYWSDAAYVAEYVLTPDELMAYVDRQWPAADPPGEGGESSRQGEGLIQPGAIATELRYLTARRLARLERWDEAADFYPPKWRERLGVFLRALQTGRGDGLPAEDRARALWEAAQIARHEGIELFGTEVEPDWHLLDGQFDWDHVSAIRKHAPDENGTIGWHEPYIWQFSPGGNYRADSRQRISVRLTGSTLDERRRLATHATKPDLRFHYRYYAADLAWEAAQLMPNESEETARVLWRAGTWLKARDPKAADRFYKAMVRRCGSTPLGREADRLRWFPKTDSPPPPPEPDPTEPVAPQEAPAAEQEEPAPGN